mmetsp:Transcript_103827/g.224082  ORF Transcript_103827/g.224082 Transcript_103827/m.224082 type:complete len:367 (-) Transcript_103827:72-1172(-)
MGAAPLLRQLSPALRRSVPRSPRSSRLPRLPPQSPPRSPPRSPLRSPRSASRLDGFESPPLGVESPLRPQALPRSSDFASFTSPAEGPEAEAEAAAAGEALPQALRRSPPAPLAGRSPARSPLGRLPRSRSSLRSPPGRSSLLRSPPFGAEPGRAGAAAEPPLDPGRAGSAFGRAVDDEGAPPFLGVSPRRCPGLSLRSPFLGGFWRLPEEEEEGLSFSLSKPLLPDGVPGFSQPLLEAMMLLADGADGVFFFLPATTHPSTSASSSSSSSSSSSFSSAHLIDEASGIFPVAPSAGLAAFLSSPFFLSPLLLSLGGGDSPAAEVALVEPSSGSCASSSLSMSAQRESLPGPPFPPAAAAIFCLAAG